MEVMVSRTAGPADYEKMLEELNGANDRAAIIVGASLVELSLEKAIKSRLREPATNDEEAKLFDGGGLFSSLCQKILVAYFRRIIGPAVRRDLNLIRLIRNYAAHQLDEISFETTSEIANRCGELRSVPPIAAEDSQSPTHRDQFLVAVKFFVAALWLRHDTNEEIAAAACALQPYLDK
jgi:hypothetical protein